MIESIIKAEVIEKHPYEMLFLAVLIIIISSGLALTIGRGGEVSHLVIAFACIAAAPLMVHALNIEEEKDCMVKEPSLLKRHNQMLQVYGY